MKPRTTQFFKALLVLSLTLTGLVLMAKDWFPQPLPVNLLWLMIAFFAAVTTAVHLLLLKVSRGRPQKFVRVFMMATMAKLLVYLIFILSLAFYFRQHAAGLLTSFLIFYLCFTFLEVYFLRRHLDSQHS